MKAFLALVINDSKFEKGDLREKTLLNSIYAGIAGALAMGGLLWANFRGFVNGGFIMWCFLILIPYGNSIYLLNKEWQEGTTGWWLTLPYSRSFLLCAKCVASFWRVLMMYATLFATTQIMTLYSNSTRPDFLPHPQLLDVFQACVKDLSWLLIVSPFSILLGALMVIITRSHWVSASLLFWAGFGLLTNLYAAKAIGLSPLSTLPVYPVQHYYLSMNGNDFYTTALIVLTTSALLFAFSVYVLDRHVEI